MENPQRSTAARMLGSLIISPKLVIVSVLSFASQGSCNVESSRILFSFAGSSLVIFTFVSVSESYVVDIIF